jgi:NAD(P)-dependent dehydrogenase (short-subunit alcohol dehydrogenase family)
MQKVILITGASSGMGKATALHLAKKGHRVFAGIRNMDARHEFEAARGLQLEPVLLDVQNDDSVRKAVKTVSEKTGKIDALVNNAGYGLLATVEDGTDEEMFRQFDVNVFGVFRLCRAVLPVMRAQKSGVIINISSFLGKMGLPLLAHYNASKYAVEAITDSLRYEVNGSGIRVHSVMAGLFGTNFVRKGLKVNEATVSKESPYASLVSHLVPIVSTKINNGPDPIAVAKAVESLINDKDSPIRVPVGEEAVTFIPMAKTLSDEDFEKKIKEIFAI